VKDKRFEASQEQDEDERLDELDWEGERHVVNSGMACIGRFRGSQLSQVRQAQPYPTEEIRNAHMIATPKTKSEEIGAHVCSEEIHSIIIFILISRAS